MEPHRRTPSTDPIDGPHQQIIRAEVNEGPRRSYGQDPRPSMHGTEWRYHSYRNLFEYRGYSTEFRFASVSPGRLNPPSRRRPFHFICIITFSLREVCLVRATKTLLSVEEMWECMAMHSLRTLHVLFHGFFSRCCGDTGGRQLAGREDRGPCAGSSCCVLDTKGVNKILGKSRRKEAGTSVSKCGQKKPKPRNTYGKPKRTAHLEV